LLTLPSIVLSASLLVAISGWLRARALAKRLERLTETYWELKYESGQLKARLSRLEVTTGMRDEPDAAAAAPRAASPTTFVPLSSLKK
jgi:hypothetical protein